MSDSIFLPNQPARSLSAARDTREAIAQASRKTGVDFDYLLAQARLESGLDPAAKARTSSASGLYQFIDSTWLEMVDRHGERLGLGSAAEAIHTVGGRARVSDNSTRSQIMALKFDPTAAALMAGALANDNRVALSGVLGREPDNAELYMAHFLGAGGASKFLRQLSTNPGVSAAAILPAPAAANRAIFYKSGGEQRSVSEVMELMRGKMATAMAQNNTGESVPLGQVQALENGRHRQFISAPRRFAPQSMLSGTALAPLATTRPSSMAETLKNSFDLTGGGISPRARDQVQSAYSKLKAFDL